MSEHDDKVIRPSHYDQLPIEPITFIMANDGYLSFAVGNVIKYVCRAGRKQYEGLSLADSALVDLSKAARYIEMEQNRLRQKEVTEHGKVQTES